MPTMFNNYYLHLVSVHPDGLAARIRCKMVKSLYMPRRHTVRVELWLHAFLTSTLEGGE
jgi:hypothetical protein